MNFFGIGGGEIVLILIVALLIWGPKRLPEIARTLGKTVNALKKQTNDLTSQITREIDTENIKSKEETTPSTPGREREAKPEKEAPGRVRDNKPAQPKDE